MNLTEALQFWCELEPVEYLEGRELSIIEYAVREAIEARGLLWAVQAIGQGFYTGQIEHFYVAWPDTSKSEWVKVADATSPESAAHALLLAHIAYLEGLVSL